MLFRSSGTPEQSAAMFGKPYYRTPVDAILQENGVQPPKKEDLTEPGVAELQKVLGKR